MDVKQIERLSLRPDIKRTLLRFQDTRFQHNGREHAATDCLGFVALFLRDFGIAMPADDGRFISEQWYDDEPLRLWDALTALGGGRISPRALQPLDVVAFSVYRKDVTHLGVMLSNRDFAHMTPRAGVSVERLEGRWLARYAGALRL